MMMCHRFYMRQSHAKNDWQVRVLSINMAHQLHSLKLTGKYGWWTSLISVYFKQNLGNELHNLDENNSKVVIKKLLSRSSYD